MSWLGCYSTGGSQFDGGMPTSGGNATRLMSEIAHLHSTCVDERIRYPLIKVLHLSHPRPQSRCAHESHPGLASEAVEADSHQSMKNKPRNELVYLGTGLDLDSTFTAITKKMQEYNGITTVDTVTTKTAWVNDP